MSAGVLVVGLNGWREKRECAGDGEEKMGGLKKEDDHLFSSILPVMFLRVLAEDRNGWRLEKCFVEADKEERAGSEGRGRKRKEMKEERG